MFVARTAWRRGDASLEGAMYVLRAARIQTVETRALRMDARFLAPVHEHAPTAHVFILASGWIDVDGAGAPHGPSMWCFDRSEFEARVPSALSFRMGGEPRCSVEVTLDAEAVLVPIGAAHGPLQANDAVLEAARRLMASMRASSEERVERCEALLDALHEAGVCRIAERAESPFEPATQRLLESLSVLYERQDTGGYVELLASLTKLSVRQVTRDMHALARSLHLPGTTLRELFRVLRLRRAVLLLSARELSLEDVAREVGYGSLDAMGRALRDAGLPPATQLRAALSEGLVAPRAG